MIMEYWKHMNFKNNLIVICILLSINNYAFAQDCKAAVSIKTDYDSSLIYLNNNFIGKGNVSVEEPAGVYLLKITKSLMQWNARYYF